MVAKSSCKSGFSLVEALVVMLILSILFAASAKVVTRKKPPEYVTYEHGEYTCWSSNGGLQEQYRIEGNPNASPNTVDECLFRPRLNAAAYNIYLFKEGNASFSTVTNINQNLKININDDELTINGQAPPFESAISNIDDFENLFADNDAFFDAVSSSRSGILISW